MRGCGLLLALATVAVFGCQAAEPSTPTPQIGRIADTSPAIAAPAAAPGTANGSPMPTAVRLLSVDPKNLVLGPADLNPAYQVGLESPTAAVHVWRATSRNAQSNARATPGLSYYMLVTRADMSDVDGVVSLRILRGAV